MVRYVFVLIGTYVNVVFWYDSEIGDQDRIEAKAHTW